MNTEKIDKVGSKLDVTNSDIKMGKIKKIVKKILYPFIQLFILGFSAISGLISATSFFSSEPCPSYPMTRITSSQYVGGITSVTLLNMGNGLFSLPNKFVKIKPFFKICVFLVIFILSIFTFELIYDLMPYESASFCQGMEYGVYNKSSGERLNDFNNLKNVNK